MNKKYEKELNKLLKNQNKISYFIELIKEELWDDKDERKCVLDALIDFCEKNDLEIAKAWAFYCMSWHYSEEIMYDRSIELLKMARDIFNYHDDKRGVLFAYNGLIIMFCNIGQYEIANEYGNMAIAFAEESDEKDVFIKILLSTSLANMYSGDFVYAKDILKIIKRKFRIEGIKKIDLDDKILYYKILIEVDLNLEIIDKKLDLFLTLEKLIHETKEKSYYVELHKLKGLYYTKVNEYDRADEEFIIANELAVENQLLIQKCENNIYWAQLKMKMEIGRDGLKLLEDSYKISQSYNLKKLMKVSSDLLYINYKVIGDYDKALFYLSEYMKEEINYNNPSEIAIDEKLNRKYSREINLINIINNRTEIISKIGEKIISNLSMKKIIVETKEELKKLVNLDFFGIVLYNKEKEEMDVVSLENEEIEEHSSVKLSEDTPFCYDCVKNKKIVVVDNIETELKKLKNDALDYSGYGTEYPLSGVFLPLKIKDEVLGVMIVESFKEKAYDLDDVNALKLVANYISISVNNAIQYDKKEKEAIYDGITGFLTKREILDKLTLMIKRHEKEQEIFSIAMIDMDNLKYINDKYGHVNGDTYIIETTKEIRKNIKRGNYVGRYGGDEFLLIFPNTNGENAKDVMETVRKRVEELIITLDDGSVISSTISVGVSEYKAGLNVEKTIECADKALYEVKSNKKNGVFLYF